MTNPLAFFVRLDSRGEITLYAGVDAHAAWKPDIMPIGEVDYALIPSNRKDLKQARRDIKKILREEKKLRKAEAEKNDERP